MKAQNAIVLGVVLAAGVAAVLAYRKASGALGGAVEFASQKLDEVAATVSSAWRNNIADPFAAGQAYGNTGYVRQPTEKEILYANYNGTDPYTGLPVLDGQWYGNADARRYEMEMRQNGTMPAATSINGAAFGLYPAAAARTTRNDLLTLQTRGRVVGGL